MSNESKQQQLTEKWQQVAVKLVDKNPSVVHTVKTQLLSTLDALAFSRITIGVTTDATILVSTDWHHLAVYLDIYFDDEEPDGYEVVLASYEQGRPLIITSGSFERVMVRLEIHSKLSGTPIN